MADIVTRMNALSVNGGSPPTRNLGNVNERDEFLVKGGPRNGPIIWNRMTAYIERWSQLPLHPVKKLAKRKMLVIFNIYI